MARTSRPSDLLSISFAIAPAIRNARFSADVKSKRRYYFLQAFQFSTGGPDVDLGAVVFDVTRLPDTTKIRGGPPDWGAGPAGRVPRNPCFQAFHGRAAAIHDHAVRERARLRHRQAGLAGTGSRDKWRGIPSTPNAIPRSARDRWHDFG